MLGDRSTDPLCDASFSECGGLEVATEVKTIREGGNNNRPIHLAGPVSYGTLSLKRGMTASFDLWDWVDRVTRDGERHLRATCEVEMLGADRSAPVATFVLTGCLPAKLKAPALNAQTGLVAIEEMEIAYEMLTLEKPSGGGGGA
ncbi:MAG: phage tail protein [Rhodococcus sp. (in: high G+C Gram-positive bacteria)]|nr:MAG: phage tail protein [Rhodococcus sp. (in: high G+C Gram-positive bacteria)]